MKSISLSDFGNGTGNSKRLDLGNLTVWFSYETPIAFRVVGESTVVSKNVWGTTTAKHLKAIDNGNKDNRIDRDIFEQMLNDIVARMNAAI